MSLCNYISTKYLSVLLDKMCEYISFYRCCGMIRSIVVDRKDFFCNRLFIIIYYILFYEPGLLLKINFPETCQHALHEFPVFRSVIFYFWCVS